MIVLFQLSMALVNIINFVVSGNIGALISVVVICFITLVTANKLHNYLDNTD